MALQNLLSQLRHNVLGSSSAVRSVYTNGICTSPRKSGMLSHMGDLHTLRFPAPLNHALQSGNQFGAGHSKFFWAGIAGESGPRFRHAIRIAGESGPRFRHAIRIAGESGPRFRYAIRSPGESGPRFRHAIRIAGESGPRFRHAIRIAGESGPRFRHAIQIAGESGPRFRHAIRIARESGPRFGEAIQTTDEIKKWMIGVAGNKIYQSLVCIAVRQGGEKLAFLPGTIIRSDGIVATSASFLSSLNSKELSETVGLRAFASPLASFKQVDVKVLDTDATYKGVLLDADFCSNIAFVKMMSPGPQKVAKFGNLDDLYPGFQAVAMGCHVRHNILRYAEPNYSYVSFSSVANKIANGESHSRTSGAFIRAAVSPDADVLGGPLIDPHSGVLGVIYSCDYLCQLKATPIVDVLKYLERLEKHG